ncbi:MAG: velvet protein [Candelina mexicana]|nr:MAG: velvet protein [Candelina mexicana]
MASYIASAHETDNTATRMTAEGKKLTYNLTVIQQPERARACGSGAKSSADRRPVDPPPIVELKILDDTRNDITFSHNANFFLFATLEPARQIAQGRVAAPAAQTFPVLTGMPVAGMAYLDRPAPAGYFIFPDLSVRHEGKYRLSFNLYEEVKEAKDADVETEAASKPRIPSPMAPTAHVYWRLEVKSAPFTVFSAKKFPGLAESTALSRIVAEQGCRVRIRRDVRMRRRDNKNAKDWDYDEDETSYVRARGTATPDPYQQAPIPTSDRARSVSHGSMDGQPPYAPELQRRPSLQELQQGYHQQAYAPPSVPQQPPQTNYLAFGGAPTPHYQTPQYVPHPPSAHPPQTYPQSQASYHHQPSSHMRQMPNSQAFNYTPNQQYQSPPYPQSQPRHEATDYSFDYRRASGAPAQAYPAQYMNMYGNGEATYSRPQPVPHMYSNAPIPAPVPRTPTPTAAKNHALPPLKTLQPPPISRSYDSAPVPTAMPGPIAAAPLPSPGFDVSQAPKPNPFNAYPTPQSATAQSDLARSTKRPFDTVFNASHMDQPLANGMRPSTAAVGQDRGPEEYEDDYDNLEMLKMSYKRADGTETSRKLPTQRF